MSDAYKEFRDSLLKITELKDEVIRIDSDPDLTEDEKYAKLAEITLTFCIHNKK